MELISTEHKGHWENQELDYQGAGASEYKVLNLLLSAMLCVVLDLVSINFLLPVNGTEKNLDNTVAGAWYMQIENKYHL